MYSKNKQQASPGFTQRALGAHKILGLSLAALMYLICLSGVVAILAHELERWEQPGIDEVTQFGAATLDADKIDSSYRQFLQQQPEKTEHIHVVFPRPSIPRLVVENDHKAFFVNHDGSIGDEENAPWSKMVADLHSHLHLPVNIGTFITGIMAVVFLALIVSGLLNHTSIFKEAFRFRSGGLKSNIDLHNRLAIWGLPFHLMIAMTSAYFGLVGIILIVTANMFYDGKQEAILAEVFGPEPELHQQPLIADVRNGIKQLQKIAPDSKPIFMTLHEAGTESQFIEFYTLTPQRLYYAEAYRFDGYGNFIEKVAAADKATGNQILMSTYRLHFGDYGGFWIKILYVLLGAGLTLICASGVNIWLAKRRHKDAINCLWAAIVWGTPTALALSFFATITFTLSPHWSFWLPLLTIIIASCFTQDDQRLAKTLVATGVAANLLGLVAYNWVNFAAWGSAASLGMNGFLLCTLLSFLLFSKLKSLATPPFGQAKLSPAPHP